MIYYLVFSSTKVKLKVTERIEFVEVLFNQTEDFNLIRFRIFVCGDCYDQRHRDFLVDQMASTRKISVASIIFLRSFHQLQ